MGSRKEYAKKVNRESPSKMAEAMAMHRFAESSKSEDERICYDPYAVHFINPKIIEYRIKHPKEAQTKVEQMEKLFPGLSSSIIARVRYFDDYVKESIEDGFEQLVILGAGYDTRGYRIEGLKDMEIFEVDHPNTQIFKIEKINEIFGTLPKNITYIPVDFETEKMTDKLLINGYDTSKKTLFILEGLVMYIPSDAVEEILSFIHKNSGNGSSIIFDYYPLSVVDGTSKLEIGRNIRNYLIKESEPLQFGIEDGKVEEFLSSRGFKKIINITSENYKKAYFNGKNANREVCSLLAFAHAFIER
jgi:methyltransferase (TIGR00027 family)